MQVTMRASLAGFKASAAWSTGRFHARLARIGSPARPLSSLSDAGARTSGVPSAANERSIIEQKAASESSEAPAAATWACGGLVPKHWGGPAEPSAAPPGPAAAGNGRRREMLSADRSAQRHRGASLMLGQGATAGHYNFGCGGAAARNLRGCSAVKSIARNRAID